MDHLHAFSEHRVREAFIEGVGALKRRLGRLTFDYPDIMQEVGRILLGQTAKTAVDQWAARSPGQGQLAVKTHPRGEVEDYPDNRKLLGAAWGLVGDGILIPRLGAQHGIEILRLSLTEKGQSLISNAAGHPLHPGFIARFQGAAQSVTDDVLSHMEDAVACLEAGVLRPAVSMAGLASEETVRIAHAAMAHQGLVGALGARPKARDILAAVASVAGTWHALGKGSADEEHRLTMACTAAEAIRVERNNASHPGHRVTDGPHVEGLLILAASHLPVFWSVVIAPAVAAGFAP
jgi:hypothetical protein